MSYRDWSNILATWVGVIAAIAGGYAALSAYSEDARKRVDERAKQTLELVQMFMSESFLPIRQKALAAVRSAERCEAAPGNERMTDSEYFAFVEFFEMIDVCLEAGLCDGKLVESFFVPYANGHWPVFKGPIEKSREAEIVAGLNNARPFGAGLERLARTKIAPPKCPGSDGAR